MVLGAVRLMPKHFWVMIWETATNSGSGTENFSCGLTGDEQGEGETTKPVAVGGEVEIEWSIPIENNKHVLLSSPKGHGARGPLKLSQ